MILQLLPVMFVLTGQAAPPPPPTLPPPQTVPATVQTAPAQSPRPVPKPYNETADAKTLIDKAVHGAIEDGINALIVWGTNDDPNCLAFDTLRRGREFGVFWSDEYKIAHVDVGKVEKNLQWAKAYGIKVSADAMPYLTVLDRQGNIAANISARDLMMPEGTFSSAKFSAFLKQHQAPNPDANKEFESALAQAKKDNKVLFLWYTAPW